MVYNVNIIVFDEFGDKLIKFKFVWDYLVQIEFVIIFYFGWMIIRKYSDFEVFYEVLRWIVIILGVVIFLQQYNVFFFWKNYICIFLRIELECYLKDVCQYQSLVESEGLRKFMERDNGYFFQLKLGFQVFEKIGKNVLGVLVSVFLEGFKVVMDGVIGVLGNIGLGLQKKLVLVLLLLFFVLQDVIVVSCFFMLIFF